MPFLPRPAAQASLVVDLARIVGAQHVSNVDADRLAYSHDCWPRDLLRLRAGDFGAAPACVVWPGSPDEVARVLQFADEHEVPVVPYGAGSGVSGGARPSSGGITLDLKRLKAVRRLEPDNLRAEIEAGIIGERLERALNRRGFTLGHFPSSILCSTFGGWLAARSAGQMSTLYGKIEDMTFGLEVATPGRVRRLMLGPRPGDGPDFNALVLGSEGVFGAITAGEVRIRPLPAAREMLGLQFPSVEAGIEGIRKMLRAGLRPAVVRLYDALDTFMGRGHGADEHHDEVGSWDALAARAQGWAGEVQKRLPGGQAAGRLRDALVRGTVRAVLGSPMVLNRALQVLPDDCLLVLGFEGHPALVSAELALAKQLCVKEGARDLGPAPGEHWLANRYNVSFKQSKVYASGLFVDTMEVAATWDRLLPLYRGVRRAIGKDAVVMAHFSHAYGEGCSIYFTFAGAAVDPDAPAEALARYDRIWKNGLLAVHEAGGTISHHHGVGESKAQAMAREHGPGGMRLLTGLKTAFDPRGTLNPGKLGLEPPRVVPPRRPRGTSTAGDDLPKEIALAVGERNVDRTPARTVVRPPDETALAAVLRVAHARGVSVVSDQTGFRAPQRSVHIDLSRFEGVSRISDHALFVEVEAGCRVDRLERLLNAHGLTLGHVHPRAVTRSVGAGVSRNLLIRRGVAFGDLGDLCFAVRGLLANGAPVETRPVPRAAVGPELDRAFIGARGRLGIITKATLRVALLPDARGQAAFILPTVEAATDAARRVYKRGLRPAAGRVVPVEGGVRADFELAAASPQILEAQRALLLSAVAEAEGVPVEAGAQNLALEGRYDAVVEAAALWTEAAATHAALAAASGGETWLDFLAPEGVTVVTRVADAEARTRAVDAAVEAGARVVAGARVLAPADQSSFSHETGAHWRDIVVEDETRRRPGPYDDVLGRLVEGLDPSGVFRER
ncbi:MAG: FAD-binding oxidoreductase [Deltaproteobacteria bacterium]|nr:FAD-binding oxidoreductase [Deltaproteobacteria bacterium]